MTKITARVDKELMDLKETLERPQVTAEQLRTAAEGAVLRMIIVATVFKRRFPDEYAKWEAED
jgi:hypothetical protein